MEGNSSIIGNYSNEFLGDDSTEIDPSTQQNNVFVQSTNSRIICSEDFAGTEKSVGISTANPYTGKDVVISPSNLKSLMTAEGEALNYSRNYFAATYTPGYNEDYNAVTDTSKNMVKAFTYDGEGFSIEKCPNHDGMMMLNFKSDTANVV